MKRKNQNPPPPQEEGCGCGGEEKPMRPIVKKDIMNDHIRRQIILKNARKKIKI